MINRLNNLKNYLNSKNLTKESRKVSALIKNAELVECYSDSDGTSICRDTEQQAQTWVRREQMPELMLGEKTCVDWTLLAREAGFKTSHEYLTSIFEKVLTAAKTLTIADLRSLGFNFFTRKQFDTVGKVLFNKKNIPGLEKIMNEGEILHWMVESFTLEGTSLLLKIERSVQYTDRFLNHCADVNQAAFAFGHELSHGLLNHMIRYDELSADVSNRMKSLIDTSGPDADELKREFEEKYNLQKSSLKRAHEIESDSLGKLLATKAGFDPSGGGESMRMLTNLEDPNEDRAQGTHPNLQKRWENLQ